MSGENKIGSPYKFMILPFMSRYVTKLWRSYEKVCGAN